MLDEAFDLFVKAAPATAMIRGVLESILSANRLNTIFDDAAKWEKSRQARLRVAGATDRRGRGRDKTHVCVGNDLPQSISQCSVAAVI